MMKTNNRPGEGARIDRPKTDPQSLAEARKLHDEIMAILEKQPPEETLEEVMSRLRGRPWGVE